MQHERKKSALRVGQDAPDFEIEAVPVKIERTNKDRLIDLIWTVPAFIVAGTILHVVIIPLFS